MTRADVQDVLVTYRGRMRIVSLLPAATLLLIPCGFPPERTEAELPPLTGLPGWDDMPAVRVLDGPAYFNRPGPRVVDGAEILADVLHR
ncbi:hypothetical protein ACFWMR_32160 [Amycolatopsis thailandensis]|uniref:hypothetical protein n=1 Tax=Amycolatopsis thailandensis TaxID=589330 RepID=UPI003650E652